MDKVMKRVKQTDGWISEGGWGCGSSRVVVACGIWNEEKMC